MTRSSFATALFAAVLALSAGAAAASDRVDSATQDRIKTMLTEQGYEVRKIEAEDGRYEAYALKDGERFEIYLNADLEVVETKKD